VTSDAKKIFVLARKVLEVPTSLEINFSTIKVGLYCSFLDASEAEDFSFKPFVEILMH